MAPIISVSPVCWEIPEVSTLDAFPVVFFHGDMLEPAQKISSWHIIRYNILFNAIK